MSVRLKKVTIKNFKAIKKTSLDLADFNVIVGTNGSGKSSVLQAMHWMFQSGRNRKIDANRKDKASTLSEKDATYMPSPNYRNAGNGQEYGNNSGTPQLDISVEAQTDEQDSIRADMWIKSARNEGLSVHVPSNNAIVAAIRNPNHEFSAYIPGLAGIPLSEEKRGELIVRRSAAAGDANMILRNILLLLQNKNHEKHGNYLSIVQNFVSRVVGDLTLNVKFNEKQDFSIQASFRTAGMSIGRFKPLELAGTGFLQIIQIFAYLVYFRPVVLLVDEPDSHLHPAIQEKLIEVLSDVARFIKTQVLITTHSPSVVRALPSDANVIWMQGGSVQKEGNTVGRRLMGWGLLDRRVLLMTEDEDTKLLRLLLAQWPALERQVAIWPLKGAANLPSADILGGLVNLTDSSLKIMLHRDRDFLMPEEIEALSKSYREAGHTLWFTRCSDIESYWAEPSIISAHFKISEEDAEALLEKSVNIACSNDDVLENRRKMRMDIMNKVREVRQGKIQQYSDEDVESEACKNGFQHKILGKDLVHKIREVARGDGLKGISGFGKKIPSESNGKMAPDLKQALEEIISGQ